jgi:GAF domain-containing protein
MLLAYGGLAAQIVTPVFRDGRLAAIVSLHQLGAPRRWTREERALAAAAGERVRALLAA